MRIAYKEFPILSAVSLAAARADLAARIQGKYDAFHSAMMATTGDITKDTVYKVARAVGLDLDRLKRDMAAPQIDAALNANLARARHPGHADFRHRRSARRRRDRFIEP